MVEILGFRLGFASICLFFAVGLCLNRRLVVTSVESVPLADKVDRGLRLRSVATAQAYCVRFLAVLPIPASGLGPQVHRLGDRQRPRALKDEKLGLAARVVPGRASLAACLSRFYVWT